jgi:hypothetical protein
MQLFPQSLPFTQFGVLRPPLAIEATEGAVFVGVAGAGDITAFVGAAVVAGAAAPHFTNLCVAGSVQLLA